MNRTSKFLLSLMAVVTLIMTIWFVASEVYIPYVTEFFESMRTADTQVTEIIAIVISVIVALFALTMLIMALASRSHEKDLTLQDGNGRLTIPKKSMEHIIDRAVANDHQVGNIQTKVKIRNKNRLQARVQVEDRSNGDYRVNAQEIQKSVQQSVRQHLGMSSDVKVQIIPSQHASKSVKVV